jgi:hypothetical protein
MTVAQTGVVDWMGIEKLTGHVGLTIVDDLDWSDELSLTCCYCRKS